MLLLVLAPGALLADEVQLRGGGSISGVIVERSATEVKVDIGAGRMSVPMSSVARIVEGPSDLSDYRQRAAALAPNDVEGWRGLGRWATEQGLAAQAKEAYTRVLTYAPGDPEANEAMGRVLWEGRWVSEEESYRAQGLVQFENEWMMPDERQLILDERAVQAQVEREEVDAAIAEAEAAHAEKAAADEAYWADAQDSWGGTWGATGIVSWDYGMGPAVMPSQPAFEGPP